jgi:hypothetical protein
VSHTLQKSIIHHRQQMNKHHGVAISQVARKLLASSMPFAPEANLSILQKYVLSPLDSLLLV